MSSANLSRQEPLLLGDAPLSLANVHDIARGAQVRLHSSVGPRLDRSVALLQTLLHSGQPIYGVTTGFGGSVDTSVAASERDALALNLVRFHGCGTGRLFDEVEARAIVVARMASLLRGYSAVRPLLLERLALLLNHGVAPAIPSEGSVGASGDLTPLSYVAAMLLGEREVLHQGQLRSCAEVLQGLALGPLTLQPKESLSLMNGSSVMTGLAALAFERARGLCRWASRLTALCCAATRGQSGHFDARLFELKPHPGSACAARWVSEDLSGYALKDAPLQDRYSLRCAPHVIGVALDQLLTQEAVLTVELNSVNDNPIVDVEQGRLLHGGNFYGGHVCQAMDSMKTCVANIADLLDRQLVLLCEPATSRGLPLNLVVPHSRGEHHGFKAMQITTSALSAEACKLTMPASVFSRSTENHNQDKVSMGSIAARDCLRVLELSEQVAAIHTLAVLQALELRKDVNATPALAALFQTVRSAVAFNDGDRRMDLDIQQVLSFYRQGVLPIGDAALPAPSAGRA